MERRHREGRVVQGQRVRVKAAVVRQHACQRERRAEILQHRRGGVDRQRLPVLAQHQEAGDVIDLRIHQHHPGNACVARLTRRLQRRRVAQLVEDVGGGVDQHPVLCVVAQGDRRLRARRGAQCAVAYAIAIAAIAVPLGKATACSRSKDPEYCHGTYR